MFNAPRPVVYEQLNKRAGMARAEIVTVLGYPPEHGAAVRKRAAGVKAGGSFRRTST